MHACMLDMMMVHMNKTYQCLLLLDRGCPKNSLRCIERDESVASGPCPTHRILPWYEQPRVDKAGARAREGVAARHPKGSLRRGHGVCRAGKHDPRRTTTALGEHGASHSMHANSLGIKSRSEEILLFIKAVCAPRIHARTLE